MSKSKTDSETKKKPESLAKKRRDDKIETLEEALAHLYVGVEYAMKDNRDGYEEYVRYYRMLKGCEPDPGLVPHEWPEQYVDDDDEPDEDDNGNETE